MHWYYTEGHLTLKVDGEEHKFSLEELISSSSAYKKRRKNVQTVFILALAVIGGLQLMGGGLPTEKGIYFYIGYLATPIFLAGFVAFLSYLFFKFSNREVSKLDSMLNKHLRSQ